MADVVTCGAAAAILGVSAPTVRAMIARGELTATRQQRGTRFQWVLERTSVVQLASSRRNAAHQRTTVAERIERLEKEVQVLYELVQNSSPEDDQLRPLITERDELRVRIIDLTYALARSNEALELQEQADAERAAQVEFLLSAAHAAERVDAHRRKAVTSLAEAIGNQHRPGLVPRPST